MSGDFTEMSMEALKDSVAEMKAENDQKAKAVDALKRYTDFLTAKPGSLIMDEYSDVSGAGQLFVTPPVKYPNVTLGGTGVGQVVKWNQVVTDPLFENRKEEDKKLQTKLFIHFAQLFVIKYPKWQLQPEPEDPFHKVKLVRPDIGASITSMYPDNQVAVYGGPEAWAKPFQDAYAPKHLPIGLVQMQIFYGWALDINAPDWLA